MFRAPLTMDAQEFMPWGEEGEFYCVQGWIPTYMMLEGVMAAMEDMDGIGMIAESLEYHTGMTIVPWFEDDEDKPDEVYEAELRAAFYEVHEKGVGYGWARFWDDSFEHRQCEENPYRYLEGGVELFREERHGSLVHKGVPDMRIGFGSAPPWVRVTFLKEH